MVGIETPPMPFLSSRAVTRWPHPQDTGRGGGNFHVP